MLVDITGLSLKDLKELQSDLTKAIASFEDLKRREALAEISEIARARGFSLAELTGALGQSKRIPAVVKYANPADPSQTWSGRGRNPLWFKAAMADGKQPEDLEI